MPAMRIPGLGRKERDQRTAQPPTQVICPVCGLRNDAVTRFCRNCGLPLGAPRDPVRGTTTRRADLPSEHGSGIAAIVGLVAVVVILVGAGFLILRGFNGSTPGVASVSPTPGHSATATPGPTGTPQVFPTFDPNQSTTPGDSSPPEPTPTPHPGHSPRPSRSPGDTPNPSGPLLGTGFTCDTGTITDPLDQRWHVVSWKTHTKVGWDVLVITLAQSPGTTRKGTPVVLDWMDPKAVSSTYGLAKPPGDRALVISFEGPVTITQPQSAALSLATMQSLDMEMDSSGILRAVIGVNGQGCGRLSAPNWADGTATSTVDIVIDVKNH